MAMSPFVERLVHEGNSSQQIWFAAACVERSAGVLFWVTSRDGRSADGETYQEVLEELWTGTVSDAWGEYVTRVERMDDLESGHERGGVAPYGFSSAALIHSCLNFGQSKYPAGLVGIADEATNTASQIGFSVRTDVAGQEVGEQLSDANNILVSDAMPSVKMLIRERARQISRDRLSLLKMWADKNKV